MNLRLCIADTQVIGEGLLPTLRHAVATLLAPGYRCVPASATVWAQVRGFNPSTSVLNLSRFCN
jgi:hypothetical protein